MNFHFVQSIIISAFFINSISCLAQMGAGRPPHLIELQNRTVIVVLKTVDEKKLTKKFKNNETKKEAYRLFVSEYNQNIKFVVESIWPYKKEFIYKTEEELKVIMKNKNINSQYIFIRHKVYDDYTQRKDGTVIMIEQISRLEVSLADKVLGKYVGGSTINSTTPNKVDLYYGMLEIINYFDKRIKTKIQGVSEEAYNDSVRRAPVSKPPF